MSTQSKYVSLKDFEPKGQETPEAKVENKPEEVKTEQKKESVEQPTEEPKAEKPVEQAPVGSENDWYNKLREVSGGKINTEDDLKNVLSQTEQYQAKLQELEQKAQESPYANELTQKIDEMFRNGTSAEQVQNFLKFQSLDIDSLEALDARKMRLMYEHGYTEQEANDYIELNYKLDEDEYEEKEVELSKKKLALDSKDDRKFLQELRVELGKTDNTKKQEQEAAFNNYKASIDSWLPNAVSGIDKVGVKFSEGDDAPSFDFTFSDEFKKEIPALAQNFVISQGLKPSEETQKAVKNYIEGVWTVMNREKIAQTAWSEAYAAAEENLRKKYSITDSRKEPVNPAYDGDNRRAADRAYVQSAMKKSPFK